MTLENRVHDAWPEAKRVWAPSILLGEPALRDKIQALAYTDLETREIFVNPRQVEERGLHESLEGILAHEVGHHLRYPGTLSLHARLQLLEKQLLGLQKYSLLNLFTDFLINEHVGRTHRDQLIAVYRAFGASMEDPPFCFYLAAYEELWCLEAGTLLGAALDPMEKEFPGYRSEAQILAQDLFNLAPNVFTQFIYFASVLVRYIPPESEPATTNPLNCDHSRPGPDDYADAIVPTAAEEEAIDRALEEGWIPKARKTEWTPDQVQARRISALPGTLAGRAHLLPAIMAAHYRRLASAYLIQPPPEQRRGDPLVPTTLEEWEPGEAVREIDWRGTLAQRGDEWGVAQPLKREREDSLEGASPALWIPKMEIYLDVSGSMPDPKSQVNAMTLAAQILCLSTIRHEGKVRALVYSGNTIKSWDWVRSEQVISKFLMNYIGGGTVFPFGELVFSVHECHADPPIRVIISDSDFDANCKGTPNAFTLLSDAAKLSRPLVLLLHRPHKLAAENYRKAGAQVVIVERLDDFPKLAADLTKSLFGDKRRAP